MRPLSTSMTRTNSIGDRGSPCRRPRAWQILLPGLPFRRIFVLAVDSKADSQSRHRRLNPMNSSSSRRNAQETVSKAFAMPTFRRMDGRLTECRSRQVSWTVRKLSWMLRPRMKAWLGRTSAYTRMLFLSTYTYVNLIIILANKRVYEIIWKILRHPAINLTDMYTHQPTI